MMRHLVIHGALLLALANVIQATDCSSLGKGACRRDASCTWLNRGRACVPTDTFPCSNIKHGKDCTRLPRCDYFVSTKCIENSEMTCSLLNTSRTCSAYRRRGCRWFNSQCVDETNIDCNAEVTSEEDCRQISKCLWRAGMCVTDNPEKRCRDCSKVTCPELLCQRGYDIVTKEGSCCPSCVRKQDCSTVRCAQVSCYEGEKLIKNPGECCPSCKKVCPCSNPNCAEETCSDADCTANEEPFILQGDCCPSCMTRMTRCRGVSCPKTLTCNIGEVVASVPGECCPVCKPEKQCPKKKSTCALPEECKLVRCPLPLCDLRTHVLITREGKCCPECVRKNDCDPPPACAAPSCQEGDRTVMDPDECCPSCRKACECEKPDCSLVKCLNQKCGPDEDPVYTEGGCCNTCVKKPQCFAPCDEPPICSPGQILFREPGACCPECKDMDCVVSPGPVPPPTGPESLCAIPEECALIQCSPPRCDLRTHTLETIEGECCPKCIPKNDCNPPPPCARPFCQEGERMVIDPGECCPKCREACKCKKPDCSLVKCPVQQCGKDEEIVSFAGGCCNSCVKKPLCKAFCEPLECSPGEVAFREPGTCCPVCKAMDCIIEPKDVAVQSLPGYCPKQNCSTETCLKPKCGPGQYDKPLIVDGECCPKCVEKPVCPAVLCPQLSCAAGEMVVQEPGDCCPSCKPACPCAKPNCANTVCAAVDCNIGEESVVPEGECCPVCAKKVDCLNKPLACPVLNCAVGEVVGNVPGECCPVCKAACSSSNCLSQPCPLPICAADQVLMKLPGECCAKCVSKPDCPTVCKAVACGVGEELVTEVGSCCPVCKKACYSKVSCPANLICPQIKCASTHRPVVPPGECCPTCAENVDCSLIACAAVACADDEASIVEPGTCCPVCKKKCPALA